MRCGAASTGREADVLSVQDQSREVFEIAGFSAIFPIFDTEDAALWSFQ